MASSIKIMNDLSLFFSPTCKGRSPQNKNPDVKRNSPITSHSVKPPSPAVNPPEKPQDKPPDKEDKPPDKPVFFWDLPVEEIVGASKAGKSPPQR